MNSTRQAHWTDRSTSYITDWLNSPIRYRIAEWVAAQIGQMETSLIVADIGSGPGQHSALIRSRHRVTPIQIDANLHMLQRSATPASPRCQALATALPLRAASVDTLIVTLLLHHLPEPAQLLMLSELRRIAKPDATLLFVDQIRPSRISPSNYNNLVRLQFCRHLPAETALQRFDTGKEDPRTVDGLRSMIEQAGFCVQSETMLGTIVWAARCTATDRDDNAH